MARPIHAPRVHRLNVAGPNEQPTGAMSVREPCADCGEDTAVGSVFYSDRTMLKSADGLRTYRCALCEARRRGSSHKPRSTDEDTSAATTVVFLGGRE